MLKDKYKDNKEGEIDIDRIARYSGHVKNCLRDGVGTYKFPHGGNDFFAYEGPWKKGSREGKGGKFIINGYAQYSGDFVNGELTGFGQKSWADGRMYEGEFVKGEMDGKGKWVGRNGIENYEGEFKENKRHGFGVLQSGTDIYRGFFSRNQMHGSGTYLFGSTCLIRSVFKENIMNDLSLIKWHKLGTMECNMSDGYAEGLGFFSTDDGSYDFEGIWEAGFPKYSLTAKYLWVDVDRPPPPTVDAKGKPIPPAKAGAAAAPGISQVNAGDCIGKVIIKANCITLAAANAATVVAAPVKGKTPPPKAAEEPPKGIPEPDIFAVPCERKRKIEIRLRSIVSQPAPNQELTDNNLGPLIPFWIKNKW